MSPCPYSARNLSIRASFCAGSVAALISASALSSGVPAPIETRLPICAPSRGASAKAMTTVTKIIRERRMVCLLLRNAGADRGKGYQRPRQGGNIVAQLAESGRQLVVSGPGAERQKPRHALAV